MLDALVSFFALSAHPPYFVKALLLLVEYILCVACDEVGTQLPIVLACLLRDVLLAARLGVVAAKFLNAHLIEGGLA